VIRDETERLDTDIQNLLDAGRISGAGVRAHLDWAEPSDIVNAAIGRVHRRLSEVQLAQDLPLVRVDPILIKRAISQIVDNAVKYSRAGSSIGVTARARNGSVEIAVTDAGAGLTAEERARMFERFYRGSRHQSTAPGSGLGLWIAQAFVIASGGELEAKSNGAGLGTTITLTLPAPAQADADPLGDNDE
jgi:two-component system sensor histidine kinase KdpD